MFYNLYWYVLLHLNSLDKWYLVNLSLNLCLRYNNGNFDIFFNFSDLNLSFIDYLWYLDFYYFILFDYPENLSNHLNFFWWQFNYFLNSYNLFDDLRLDNKYLLCMYNRHNLFNNLFHYLNSCLNMRDNLGYLLISYNFYYLFHNLRNNNYLLSLYNLLDNFLNNNFNRFDYLFFSLNISNYFFDDLYRL